MNLAICAAISGRKVVSFTYEDLPRIVQPCCHGRSSAGNDVLRGYQTGGQSTSGPLPAWRLFDASKILAFRQTGDVFRENPPDYRPNDRGMTEIYCQL